jgi:hypothetical protein
VAYINEGSITQTLDGTCLTAGIEYVLRVEVGWRNDVPLPLYAVTLYAGDPANTLASDSVTELVQGGWRTSTVSYTSTVCSGQKLGISLKSLGGGQVDFDHVRLEAIEVNSIPEPYTVLLLLGSALIVLVGVQMGFRKW